MKSISSAILVLAGAVIYSAGSLNSHGDTQMATCILGALLGIFGLLAWFASVSRNE